MHAEEGQKVMKEMNNLSNRRRVWHEEVQYDSHTTL